MKARVKGTDVELEVHLVDKQARYIGSDGGTYWEEDLDFGIEDKNNPDYWTRLEHTYAGMFMKSFLDNFDGTATMEQLSDDAIALAHALVEKLKEKEERK